MLYEKETLILDEATTTLLSNKIRKRPNQIEQEGLSLLVMKKKGEKKSLGSSKACLFYHKEGNWKNYKYRQE